MLHCIDWTVLRHDVLCKIFEITTIVLIAVVAGNVCDALEEAGISDVFVRDIRGCRSQAAQISSLASSHGGAERIGCDEDESIPHICHGSHGYSRVKNFWPV